MLTFTDGSESRGVVEIGGFECDCLVVIGNDWWGLMWIMLGSVGGVFSASGFGSLGFEVDFLLEENDLGRRFLIDDVEDMVFDERENNVDF